MLQLLPIMFRATTISTLALRLALGGNNVGMLAYNLKKNIHPTVTVLVSTRFMAVNMTPSVLAAFDRCISLAI